MREYRLEKNHVKQQEAQFARAAPGSSQRYELEATLEQVRVRKSQSCLLAAEPKCSQKRVRLQALHWRAIRAASTQHLRHFSAIGAGDIEKLESLVDDERRRKEEEEERLAEAASADTAAAPSPKKEYDSDSSVLGLHERKSPEVAKNANDGSDAKPLQEEAGTPEPEDAAKKTGAGGEDEPGTPPPKEVAMPGTPGTPKRPREEDVPMQDGEVEAKRQRVE